MLAGRMTSGLLLGLSLLGGATMLQAAGVPDLERYRVTRPGEVLFDRAERRAVLEQMPIDQRRRYCGTAQESWPSHKAVTRVKTPVTAVRGDRTDSRSEPFAWTVMTATAAAFGLDDGAARAAVIANLRRWARGKALTKLEDHDPSTYYSLDRTLLPTIVGFALVRDHPDLSKQERKLIERWLNRLVRLRGIKRRDDSKGPISQRNNHRYLSDSVDMAWGAFRGNDALFRQGVASYLLALGEMRADGSLPLETARGSKALWYQRQAIASLVAIAEMAAVQGYALYPLEVAGRSLHDAIRFLLEAIDRPEIVWPYAQANLSPGRFQNYLVQNRGFMVRRGHGRHYMAWTEAYRARFPERPEAARVWRQLQAYEGDLRPMIDEYSGGNTTCFFAPATAPAG